MKFEHHHPDLTIIATTGKEIEELCKHFRLPIADHVDDLIAGTMAHTVSGAKRPWFHLTATVPFTFLQPYYDVLKKVTGYDGAPFLITHDRLKYGYSRDQALCHTHIVEVATISDIGYTATGFIQSQDWNGETATVRAPRHFDGYLRAHLGQTEQEPEYIQYSNGLLSRNPKYGRVDHPPHPAASSEAVFEVIFGHWLDNVASAAQQAAYVEGDICYRMVCKAPLCHELLRNYSGAFHINNYKERITFEQFKEMA